MAVINKLGVFSLAKIMALYNLVFGVLIAILSIIAKIFVYGPLASYTWSMAVIQEIIFIIAMPIFGFILGLVIALILNWALKVGGGLEISLE